MESARSLEVIVEAFAIVAGDVPYAVAGVLDHDSGIHAVEHRVGIVVSAVAQKTEGEDQKQQDSRQPGKWLGPDLRRTRCHDDVPGWAGVSGKLACTSASASSRVVALRSS